MTVPDVTVIVAVYNTMPYLTECLTSVLGQSIGKMGAMTVMISTVAMLWNMVFNAGFDRLRARFGFTLNLKARALHAISFEVGLVFMVVPMVAWWLSISLRV